MRTDVLIKMIMITKLDSLTLRLNLYLPHLSIKVIFPIEDGPSYIVFPTLPNQMDSIHSLHVLLSAPLELSLFIQITFSFMLFFMSLQF